MPCSLTGPTLESVAGLSFCNSCLIQAPFLHVASDTDSRSVRSDLHITQNSLQLQMNHNITLRSRNLTASAASRNTEAAAAQCQRSSSTISVVFYRLWKLFSIKDTGAFKACFPDAFNRLALLECSLHSSWVEQEGKFLQRLQCPP